MAEGPQGQFLSPENLEAFISEHKRAEQGLRFLSDASIELSSSLDYQTTLASVAKLAVPRIADWCTVHVVEDGKVESLATAHVDPAKVQMARELESKYPFDPEAPAGAAAAIRTGKSELIPEIPDAMLEAATDDRDLLAILRDLGLTSSMVVPLVARGHTLGAITFVSAESGKHFTLDDLTLAEDLGRRAALAVDNARLHREALSVAAKHEAVLSQMADCVVMIDAAGRIIYANEASRTSSIGIHIGDHLESVVDPYNVRTVHGERFAPEALPLARALRGETVVDERWVVQRFDGSDAVFQGSASPVVTIEGTRLGAVCTYRDVTAQATLERQKDEFLSSAAHDLKTPLTSIKGLAQLLQRRVSRTDSSDNDPILEGLNGIASTASRMNRLINELLDVTRLQMGRPLELNLRSTDLVLLARESAAEFLKGSDSHPIRVRFPSCPVVGVWDTDRLERVLGNLLSNATKYSPPGSEVTLTVAIENRDDEQWAILSVHDHGRGIPPDDLPHIFERFYRAQNVNGSVPGTGIGLAGALHIVEQHGGSIEVESREDRGSTFTVRLPVRQTQAVE